jgi:hypothetical protein
MWNPLPTAKKSVSLEKSIGRISIFGLDNLMDMLFVCAMESLNRNERVIQLLKRLGLDPDHPPADFTAVYKYALVEYGVGKPRPVVEIFRQKEIQDRFREAFERWNLASLINQAETQWSQTQLPPTSRLYTLTCIGNVWSSALFLSE